LIDAASCSLQRILIWLQGVQTAASLRLISWRLQPACDYDFIFALASIA